MFEIQLYPASPFLLLLFIVFPKHSLQLYSLKNKKLLLQAKINARFA